MFSIFLPYSRSWYCISHNPHVCEHARRFQIDEKHAYTISDAP